jgi:beta-N-acetylhexosaminidase
MPKNVISRRLAVVAVGGAAALALAATGVVPAQAAPGKAVPGNTVPGNTVPGNTAPGPDARVAAAMRTMSVQDKVGQLFVQNVYGKDATTPDARNIPLYGVASPTEVIRKYHLGGIIYFAWTDSVQNPPQIVGLSNGLQRAAIGTGAHIPLMIATDQEQGVVTRIGPPATQFLARWPLARDAASMTPERPRPSPARS